MAGCSEPLSLTEEHAAAQHLGRGLHDGGLDVVGVEAPTGLERQRIGSASWLAIPSVTSWAFAGASSGDRGHASRASVGPYGSLRFLVAVDEEPGEMRVEVALDGIDQALIVAHDGHPFKSAEDPMRSSIVEAEADAGSSTDSSATDVASPAPRDSGAARQGKQG